MSDRASFLSTIEWFNLNTAMDVPCKAYGYNFFLVGSCLVKREFRDVDIRYIDTYQTNFLQRLMTHPTQKLTQITLSEWLSNRTGLLIDLQFQTMEEADQFKGQRIPLGETI